MQRVVQVEHAGLAAYAAFRMSYDSIQSHLEMLQDSVRTTAYRKAIQAVVRPGDRVLDFGCGTGVLSIFAERAGASRVYAVDRSRMLSAAKTIFEENGCKNIETVSGDGDQVQLPSQVDVIVSEWMGHFLFAEQMLEPLLRLRDNFLRKGGRMIPASCSLHIGLIATNTYLEDLSFLCTRPYGIDFSSVGDWPFREVGMLRIAPSELLPETVCVSELDLHTITGTPRALSGTITSAKDASVYGLCGWFDAQLSEGVKLSTSPFSPATHWLHFHFPFERPLDVHAGEPIEIDIQIHPMLGPSGYTWQARTGKSVRTGRTWTQAEM
jgi:precorrin-6B methylase 2